MDLNIEELDLSKKGSKKKKQKASQAELQDETIEEKDEEGYQGDEDAAQAEIPEAPESENFEKFGVGSVTVPIREATEFMARLEEAKVTPTTLRKSVTDLSHENKFWRDYAMRTHKWAQELKRKLDEAKRQGKTELDIPPFPEAPFILQQQHQQQDEGRNEYRKQRDTGAAGDDEYLKGFAKVIGPYIALGKYLKGDDGDSPGRNRQEAQEAQGMGMVIKRVEPDGSVMYIPAYMASQFMIPPNAAGAGSDKDKEIVIALGELAKNVAVLNERVRSVESKPQSATQPTTSPVSTIKEVIGLMTEMRGALMPVTPTSYQEAREADIEKERIRQKEETRRAELAAQNKMLDVYSSILSEDSQKQVKEKERAGKDFIDKMTEEVKKISAEV